MVWTKARRRVCAKEKSLGEVKKVGWWIIMQKNTQAGNADEMVQKYIQKHIQYEEKYFGGCCSSTLLPKIEHLNIGCEYLR